MGGDAGVTPSLDLNRRAARIAEAMAADADVLGIRPTTLENGTRVLDCGVEQTGGLEAGRLLAETCMGGAGNVDFAPGAAESLALPGVVVWTDHPAEACLAAQYAGWAVHPEGYFAMGSGPLRAIARVETELYQKLDYDDPAEGLGVLVLETSVLPEESVADWLAAKSGLPADRLILLAARTASLAGGVQIAARVVETALHKLAHLGFDVRKVVSGFGSAPAPPVAKNDLRAIGRTNDCVLYGGSVHLHVRADDDELSALTPRLPSSASRDYGLPFYDLFQRYDRDFYKVDPELFSPAEVALTSTTSGRTFTAGSLNPDVLRQSLLG